MSNHSAGMSMLFVKSGHSLLITHHCRPKYENFSSLKVLLNKRFNGF